MEIVMWSSENRMHGERSTVVCLRTSIGVIRKSSLLVEDGWVGVDAVTVRSLSFEDAHRHGSWSLAH